VVFDELMAIRVDAPVDGSTGRWPSSRSSGFAGVAVPGLSIDRWIEDMWLEPQPWEMSDMKVPNAGNHNQRQTGGQCRTGSRQERTLTHYVLH